MVASRPNQFHVNVKKALALFVMLVAAFVTPGIGQIRWSNYSPSGVADDIWCVTNANGTFAAVTNQGNLLTSADGMTWASQTIDSGVWLVSIAYGNGTWVVVGNNGTIMVSPDLKTWTSETSPTTNKLNGVIYNGTVWVAVGEVGTIVTSPDAQNWTLQPSIPGVTGFLHGITLTGGATPENGLLGPVTNFLVCGENGVLLGAGSTGVNFAIIPESVQPSGVIPTQNFEAILNYVPGPINPQLGTGANGETVIVGDGIILSGLGAAVGSTIGSNNFTSSAGVPSIDFRGLAYGFGYWVAAGEQGTIFCSTDGINWQQSNSGSTATLLSAAYSSKLQRIVVTGMGGTILVANAPPPSITQQPTSQSEDIQGSVSFTVTAGGAPTLTYQWFKNGSPISGATSSTLTLSNVQNSDAASYTVVVANDVGIATSSAATLTVLDIPVINGVPSTTTPASIGLPFQLGLTLLDNPSTVTVTGLPPGLTFNASTNTISGTPTTAGTYSVAINASNSFGNATPVTLSMTVSPTPLVFNPLAGGQTGSSDGTGTAAEFNSPNGLAIDSQGNLYVADTGNYTIRKVSASGVVTTIAGTPGLKGSSDGKGAAALFSSPTGIAVDATGNLYVTDTGNNTVRKIDTTGQTSTIAGTPGVTGSTDNTGSEASFNGLTGIAVDSSGNLYVADSGNDTIRKISPAGAVTTLAGLAGQSGYVDAFGIGARLSNPTGVALDAAANIYVNDDGNSALREITPTGSVSTLALLPSSNYGLHSSAFNGVTLDSTGNVYTNVGPTDFVVADALNGVFSDLVTIAPSGTVTTLQQWENEAFSPVATSLTGVARDGAGNLYILVNGVLEKSSLASGPTISAQPLNQAAVAGQTVTFSVAAKGNPLPSYQWLFNGSIISGATSSTLTLTDVTTAQAGSYSVSVFTPYTSVTSRAGNLTVTAPTTRLINISTRAQVGTGGNVLIPGFVIGGGGTETLLIRADGPGLTQFGVGGVLAQPSLVVVNSSGTTVASNTGWGNNTSPTPAQIANIAAQVGAFALPSDSADCALVVTLSPGAYTVQVSGVGATTGVALAEIYEVSFTATARLINISTRAQVGTGANLLIPGFVIGGSGTEQLLVRGDGPSLTQFGVSGVLAQPSLSVYSGSTVIASNTGWGTSTNPTPAQIASVAVQVGAFPFASGSADCAQVVNLTAGAYTMQISGGNSTTGVALAEIYEVP
jgi:sugar lactone lactonase YvrE